MRPADVLLVAIATLFVFGWYARLDHRLTVRETFLLATFLAVAGVSAWLLAARVGWHPAALFAALVIVGTLATGLNLRRLLDPLPPRTGGVCPACKGSGLQSDNQFVRVFGRSCRVCWGTGRMLE